MLYSAIETPDSGSENWAKRSEFWRQLATSTPNPRKRRERVSKPLILCGHGVSLRIENGALVIRDGFTHYPQKQERYRYFRGDLNLPKRIFLLDGSGTLSFDVLSWLGEQGVTLARIKWTGDVAMVASNGGSVADRAKVQWQERTRLDEFARLTFSTDLIARKLAHSIDTLQRYFPAEPKRDRAIDKISKAVIELRDCPPGDLSMLRAVEAVAAGVYFCVWQSLTLKWTGTQRRPVPDEWKRFAGRTSLANGSKPKNVNASHPINALLNYAYAVKTAQLQIQTVAQGYDPTIGIMHQGRRGAPAFIFDLIEPERPKVDAAILAFIYNRTFASADFLIRPDGVCRLSPQLARAVAATMTTA